MKLSKLLSLVMFITCFSLLYVYQQTEIFRLAYLGQRKQAYFNDLLDKNSILRYNIEKNASLACIGNQISMTTDFKMPDTYRLMRLVPSQERIRLKEESHKKETIFSRLFGIKAQAEARTISTSTSFEGR